MTSKRPFLVLVPAASHNPSHYGYLFHLLQQAGYPTLSALLPSVGASGNVTVEDDTEYVKKNMLLPILDHEERDVIIVSHSYSGVPASAAAKGLGKAERAAQGKKTGVIGQIFICAVLTRGGDGKDVVGAFGGQYPPHIRPDPEANLLRCDDRIPPLFQDIPVSLADVAAVSAMAQGMSSFTSPCPRATWDSDEYKGRVAYIRTLNDACIPLPVQQMMIDRTEAEWIVRDIESGHSPQIARPEELVGRLVGLAGVFEEI
ncbi:alpha/beta-hydrolase [Lojkania enalia]|uniref:Alpha/beta-hydrolase n=1 Tax=Lojkania enalia TaxID=147567 RepID=A0A9P4MWX2_9PLEO|nr:alpha/beta-hydrolase [Didymosphaeria enalia]